jgi:hypothetical protein
MATSLQIQPQDMPVVVNLPALVQFDADSFFEFCRVNEDLHIERTAQGGDRHYAADGVGAGCAQLRIGETAWELGAAGQVRSGDRPDCRV